ncbi:MAG: DUF167 domain-containing protein [Myxococcota bacterium]
MGEEALDIWIHVHPRASRTAVGGEHDGALEVRVTAPPTEGRANRAVCRAVAEALGVRPRSVQLVSGGRGRRKRLRIEGNPAEIERRLQRLGV